MTTTPRKLWRVRAAVAAVAAFSGAAAAGDFNFNPYVDGQYIYDSNVYRFSNQVATVTGTRDTADRHQRYAAGLDTGYTWQQQALQFTAEGRRFKFEELTHLDHDEYLFAVNFNGGVLSNTRGALHLAHERRMASFEDRRTTRLIMEEEEVGQGALTVAVTPQWHAVVGARGRRLRSPLPDAPALPQPPPGAPARIASPNFAVHEAAINAGVQFGIENKEHPEDESPLLVGVLLEYSAVDFSGVTPQPPPPPGVTRETFNGYSLLALGATVAYTLNGLSSLDGKLGVTMYDPSSNTAKSKPDITGEVGYVRRLSVLTQVNAHLFRRIVPYAATADATTDTGASVGAKWEALQNLMVVADYSLASSAFSGLSGVAPENAGRNDSVQNASLSVAYPLVRALVLKLSGTYNDRRSSLSFNNYNDITAGVELSYRWGAPKAAAD